MHFINNKQRSELTYQITVPYEVLLLFLSLLIHISIFIVIFKVQLILRSNIKK